MKKKFRHNRKEFDIIRHSATYLVPGPGYFQNFLIIFTHAS